MRKATLVVNCVLGATIATLTLAVVTCLYLMATASEGSAKRTGLFGGVFFETVAQDDGSILMGTGVENWVPLAVVFAALCALILVTACVYGGLREYKRGLQESSRARSAGLAR